ncbi:caspase family protein [Yoonia sp. R2331]|uniref:caspase family protein n=1 Tax=Yoonia sp. R2331 TaxID=3237238 RepID=UPI0034E4BBCD
MTDLARFGGVAGLCLAAGQAAAQDRNALVIANTGYAAEAALDGLRRDTEKMSEALFGLGFTVTRLENAAKSDIDAALADLAAKDGPGVVYYAGHGFALDGVSYVLPVGAAGETPEETAAASVQVVDLLGRDGARVVMLDTCHGAASQGIIGAGALDASLAEVAAVTPDLALFSAVPPGVACPAEQGDNLTAVLLDRLTVPGLPSSELLPPRPEPVVEIAEDGTETVISQAGLWAASTLPDPFVFRPATSGVALTQKDYEMLESVSPSARAQLLAMWQDAGIAVDFAGEVPEAPASVGTVTEETVVLMEPVRPVSVASAVSPVSVAASNVGQVQGDVSILTVAPQPVSSAPRPVPGAGGLPTPSIIVGYPEEVVEASFDVAPDDDGAAVGGSEVSAEDVALRRDFAENNRELYLNLVESGAFDPPEPQLARSIQTEMKRMNCYYAEIDGIWGGGSRRSVTLYFSQFGGEYAGQDPSIALWRQILLKDDVRCPDQVIAAPAPRQSTTQSAPRRQTTTQSAPRRATPAPAAPAPAAPARRTLSNTGGTGVFR